MVLIVAAAAWLRLADLDNRLMHCDEAVHALRFRSLLEEGRYTYDPHEYHGPSLNYLTLPVAGADSADDLAEVTETHLRLVPAVCGILLVALLWPLRRVLGPVATLFAAALTALSPAMVFYSRYYIQEMLLVCSTFAAMVALQRLSTTNSATTAPNASATNRLLPFSRFLCFSWLGLAVGMMHASKETCVIALGAMVVAAAVVFAAEKLAGKDLAAEVATEPYKTWRTAAGHGFIGVLVVAVVAAAVSALFFSSFFTNPAGVADSYATYIHYAARAAGEGSAGPQDHPWHYYFELLFWHRDEAGWLWTEGAVAALALVGLAAGAIGKGLPTTSVPAARFLGVYTVLVAAFYSYMPYKTPWCALGFSHGTILLGGIGAAVLVRLMPHASLKAAMLLLLSAAAGHLGWQAHRASFIAQNEPGNPYVHTPTHVDVPRLAEALRQIAAAGPKGQATPVQLICPDDDYWPLPWYLRDFEQLGGLREVPDGPAAPLIVTRPKLSDPVPEHFCLGQASGFVPLVSAETLSRKQPDWQLRRYVSLAVHVQADLWEAFAARQAPNDNALQVDARNDLLELRRRLERIAAVHPDGMALPIQVVCPGRDYWPLPWYLRGFTNVSCHDAKPPQPAAPLIIAEASMQGKLLEYLFEDPPPGERPLYMFVWPADKRPWQLRPDRRLEFYARQYDMCQEYGATKSGE